MSFWKKIFPSKAERNRHLFGDDETLREKVFEKLVEDIEGKVYAVIRKKCSDEAAVEDICQDAFTEYWKELASSPDKRAKLKDIEPVAAVIQNAISFLSKWHKKEQRLPKTNHEVWEKTADNYENNVYQKGISDSNLTEEIDTLKGIFGIQNLLNVDDKIKLLLEYFKDKKKGNCYAIFKLSLSVEKKYTQKDMADLLNTTEDSIKTQAHRCREKAQEYFNSLGIFN